MSKKTIECDFEGCFKSYCSAFNLKRHIESSHFGTHRFKCSVCQKEMSSKQNLIDHQNIHTGAKPYKCEFPDCNLRFKQLSQYYIHKHVHKSNSNKSTIEKNYYKANLDFIVSKLAEVPLYESAFTQILEPYSYTLPQISSPQYFINLPSIRTLRTQKQ
jgi:Zinc finger, C2H2 type